MNIITSFFRWLVALFVALCVWVIVVTVVPIAVVEQQVLVRTNAVGWATIATSSDEGINSFREGLISGLATNKEKSEDPIMQALFVKAVDPTSSLGAAVRNVITPASVRENLLINVNRFFDWYEGKSVKLNLYLKLAGSSKDHIAIATAYVKEQYSQLPKCRNAAEVKAQATKDFPTCQTVSPDKADYSVIAGPLVKSTEYKEVTTKGRDFPINASVDARDALHQFQNNASRQFLFVWIVVVIGALFMIALFTPKGVSLMATGVVLGSAGLVLFFESAVIQSIGHGSSSGSGATTGVVLDTSMIILHAWLLTAIGAGLVIWGIVLPFIGKNKAEPNTTDTNTGNLTSKTEGNTPVEALSPSKKAKETTTATVVKKRAEEKKA